MCGRYNLTTSPEAMRQLFRFLGNLLNLPPRYNIAPTQDAPIVRRDTGGARELAMLRWGLIPPWSEEPTSAYSTINARAETVTQKPTFRSAFKSRRCLVPADGFYEWQKVNGRKQPYHIRLKDGGTFAFAGLWEHWEKRGHDPVESFTIIVTAANDLLRPIHDRMPVILDPADYNLWLDRDPKSAPAAKELLRPFPSERMAAYPIGTRVNSPRNDDASIIEPLA